MWIGWGFAPHPLTQGPVLMEQPPSQILLITMADGKRIGNTHWLLKLVLRMICHISLAKVSYLAVLNHKGPLRRNRYM